MQPEVRALIDGSRDAVRRVIADLREKAETAEQLRSAEHRAFMAEQREALAALVRQAGEKIAAVRDGVDGKDGRDGADGENGADGRDGVDGAPGEPGEPGEAGRDGVDGKDGRDGADGENGADGRDGVDGAPGEPGEPGEAGRDGVDGKDGLQGEAGKDGERGVDGTDGKDGRDGLGGEDVDVEMVDDRTIKLSFAGRDSVGYEFELAFPVVVDRGNHEAGSSYEAGDLVTFDGALWIAGRSTDSAPGDPAQAWRLAVPKAVPGNDGPAGVDAYPGEARGLFAPDVVYRAMDVVSFNGSEWRAKSDDPGGLPGDGWMLSASRGKRGDRGERGPDGARGKDGSSIAAAYVDTKNLHLTLTRDDGVEVKADLYDLAQVIRG